MDSIQTQDPQVQFSVNGQSRDVFGPGANIERRHVKTYEEIANIVGHCRGLGWRIVLTMGAFDILHPGHARYLEKGKQLGDIFIVGIDEDEKVKKRKGKHRPIETETGRLEMLCHLRHVDLVFIKKLSDEHWQLVKTVRPDVLLATQATYSEKDIESLKEFCGKVVVLEPQATTSTTARIRLFIIEHGEQITKALDDSCERIVGEVNNLKDFTRQLFGGGK